MKLVLFQYEPSEEAAKNGANPSSGIVGVAGDDEVADIIDAYRRSIGGDLLEGTSFASVDATAVEFQVSVK